MMNDDQAIIGYCFKCKAKRQMERPEAVFASNGAPGTRGTCPLCGGNIFKMGRTSAHDDLPPPDITAKPKPSKTGGKKRSGTGRPLVIVESPAKARTVGRFLGRGYAVKASVGHVRDLPRTRLGVDVEEDFQPRYLVPKKQRQTVKDLRAAAKDAKLIYLATDPDREGEAIAWHLAEALKLDEDDYRRVVFHEITKPAIDEAFRHERGIDMDLVNAQQARRVLDRLVGFKISPILWRKVRNRLSAGRVQSVALRIVVEREREIEAFVAEEYWTIEAELDQRREQSPPKRAGFRAKLHRVEGQEPSLVNEAQARAIVDDLEDATFVTSRVKTGQRRRRPAAPFTTSTMQQAANQRLHFTAKRAMANAQQLYEGVDIGEEGTVGLITYMRTDSVHIAEEAQAEARAYIRDTYGQEYVPDTPPTYKTKARKAQEAHEAIRPTSVRRTPERMKAYLGRDQLRLYRLIWQRFVASQMVPAVYDTTSADVMAGHPQAQLTLAVGECLSPQALRALIQGWRYLFRVSGSVLRFPGFLRVYGDADEDKEEDVQVPILARGEWLDLLGLFPEQHFTQPPPRYSEATLVKELEERGIGRPSTYAATISTLQAREYVQREGRQLRPTELGCTVNDLLVEHFPNILDYDFTAHMEEDLDRIADGDQAWVEVLRAFYGPFSETLKRAEAQMPELDVEEAAGIDCPACGAPMIIKHGRYGKFISCSRYPECKESMPYKEKVGVACPDCGGDLIVRRTRKGRTFYGCDNYPDCQFAVWNRPLPTPCPQCGGLMTDRGRKGPKCVKCGHEMSGA